MIVFAALAVLSSCVTGTVPGRAAPSPSPTPAPRLRRCRHGPPSDAVGAVLQQSPAFAADTGRTDLQATRRVGCPSPASATWATSWRSSGRTRTAPRTPGSPSSPITSVRDVPWMVKAEPWGLVQVLEDKTIDGVVDDLKRARMAANEAVAVGDIRTIYSAQMLFMAVADGVVSATSAA